MDYDDEDSQENPDEAAGDNPPELNNELSELEALGGGGMNADAVVEKDYVEPSKHDMRRTKQVNADMSNKLIKQEEENKDPAVL